MNKARQRFIYIFVDAVICFSVWLLFFIIRRYVFEGHEGELTDKKFMMQLRSAGVITAYWLLLYGLAGLYNQPFRKSRLKEITQIIKYTAMGVLVIFFAIFLDDLRPQGTKLGFYLFYFILQFTPIALVHFLISTRTNSALRQRKIGFPTIIVGNGPTAFKIWNELESRKKSLGYTFKGFVHLDKEGENLFYGKLKNYGHISRLREIIQSRGIEEVILALEDEDHKRLMNILDNISDTQAFIKIVPHMYDYIVGGVRTTHILGAPLIEIFPQILSNWEKVTKRAIDITASLAFLAVFSWLYLLLAILIKINSKGPVFFRQERVGKGGKPFKIIKFRSMYVDAEKFGPALSSENDPRITPVGKFLRKSRLDEIPQFINVLKGEMSLVGPRPERQFFIDQIVQIAPHYRHLHRVRPGVTSWGQVKFGYAENVDEMVERLKFDILYIENMSLLLDIKILLYTVIVMIEGRGK